MHIAVRRDDGYALARRRSQLAGIQLHLIRRQIRVRLDVGEHERIVVVLTQATMRAERRYALHRI